VLPDADEAIIHVYAEGETEEASAGLAEEVVGLVGDVMDGQEFGVPEGITSMNSQVEVDGSEPGPL
jgi:hypothetical protein